MPHAGDLPASSTVGNRALARRSLPRWSPRQALVTSTARGEMMTLFGTVAFLKAHRLKEWNSRLLEGAGHEGHFRGSINRHMALTHRKLRTALPTRLLSLVLAYSLFWIGVQHARFLCHVGAEHTATASPASPASHKGGCHDSASPSAPGQKHSSLPPCCITGVLVAALPTGKSLTLATSVSVLQDLSAVIPVAIVPSAAFPTPPLRSLARANPGESTYRGVRSHLAHRTLLI